MNRVAASPGRLCNNHLFRHAAKAKSTGSTITAGLLHSLKRSIQGWLMHSEPRRTICTETHAASSEEASLKPRLKGNSFWSENNQKIRKQKGNKYIYNLISNSKINKQTHDSHSKLKLWPAHTSCMQAMP